MRRPLLYCVFGMILATEMCTEEDCQPAHCTDHPYSKFADSLDPGNFFEFTADDCNACAHASLAASWGFPDGVVGDITFKVTAECTAKAGIGDPDVRPFPATASHAEFEATNIKNQCGANGPMKYSLNVRNGSSKPLSHVAVTFTCPHDPNPTGLVAPSPTSGAVVRR